MRRYKAAILLAVLLVMSVSAAAERGAPTYDADKRDPFIPLIDDKGDLRRNFARPPDQVVLPKISLAGISFIGGEYYALIDGELMGEGSVYKDLMIEKIDAEKVTVSYQEKQFQIWLEADKK